VNYFKFSEFDKYLILDLINTQVQFFNLINICCKKIIKVMFYFEPVQIKYWYVKI